jgi:uncharacterized protein YfeS
MQEAFYFNVSDYHAPFGNDDGSDMAAGFIQWREQYPSGSPLDYLKEQLHNWEYLPFDWTETDARNLQAYLRASDLHERFLIGTDQCILAVAFAQLYLEGDVQQELLVVADQALQRQLHPFLLDYYWSKEQQIERKKRLLPMQRVVLELLERGV